MESHAGSSRCAEVSSLPVNAGFTACTMIVADFTILILFFYHCERMFYCMSHIEL